MTSLLHPLFHLLPAWFAPKQVLPLATTKPQPSAVPLTLLGSIPVPGRISPYRKGMGSREPGSAGSPHLQLHSPSQGLAANSVTGETNSWFGKHWVFKCLLRLAAELGAVALAGSLEGQF